MIRSLILLLSLLFVGAGCGQSSNPGDTSALEKAFQIGTTAKSAAPALDPKVKALVEEALAAIKKKDYGASLLPLAALRSIPELSVEQTSAVQDLYGNVQVRLAELADKGDTNAQKALDSIRGAARR